MLFADSGLMVGDQTGVFGTLVPNDIWKPDNGEITNDSFASDSFFPPDPEAKCHQERVLKEEVPLIEDEKAPQPSIADLDSAIQTVIYSEKEPQPPLEPEKAENLSEKMSSSWGDSLLGYSSLSALSTEYLCSSDPICQLPMPDQTYLSGSCLSASNCFSGSFDVGFASERFDVEEQHNDVTSSDVTDEVSVLVVPDVEKKQRLAKGQSLAFLFIYHSSLSYCTCADEQSCHVTTCSVYLTMFSRSCQVFGLKGCRRLRAAISGGSLLPLVSRRQRWYEICLKH